MHGSLFAFSRCTISSVGVGGGSVLTSLPRQRGDSRLFDGNCERIALNVTHGFDGGNSE